MSEWREMTLGELTENYDGQRIPVKETERKPGMYPYYGASGVVDYVDRFIFDGEYLLIAEDGENLRTQKTPIAFLARGKFWVNNHAHIVTGNSKADTRFLMYALNNGDISGFLTGSTMPKLTQGNMNRIPVLAPPLPEQRAIASVLGALDDKIELNRRMNETLEALAQTLFKSWFVPARRSLGAGGDATQSALPKGWRETRLEEMAAIAGGKQLPTVDCKPSGKFTVFGANGIMGYADRATHDEFVIAFGRVGAYCGSIHWSYRGAWINNNASSVVPHRWPEFVLQAMLNVDFEAMRTGSAQPFIPNSSLAAAKIIRPLDDILDSYCSIVRPLRLKQTLLDEESRTLAALRDALLPKLLSGELRVPTATKLTEASA